MANLRSSPTNSRKAYPHFPTPQSSVIYYSHIITALTHEVLIGVVDFVK